MESLSARSFLLVPIKPGGMDGTSLRRSQFADETAEHNLALLSPGKSDWKSKIRSVASSIVELNFSTLQPWLLRYSSTAICLLSPDRFPDPISTVDILSNLLLENPHISFISLANDEFTKWDGSAIPSSSPSSPNLQLLLSPPSAKVNEIPSSVWRNGSIWRGCDLLSIAQQSTTYQEWEGRVAEFISDCNRRGSSILGSHLSFKKGIIKGAEYPETRESNFHNQRTDKSRDEKLLRYRPDPIITLIIPTYNRPDLLRRSVDSVLAQSFGRFEIIVVNDGGELPILTKDPRITIVSHEHNRGLAASRNTGIERAQGLFVGYLDDDDVLLPDHFSLLLDSVESSGASVVYANAIRRWEIDGRTVRRDIPYREPYSADELLFRNITPVQTILHRRECVQKGLRFDEHLKRGEDWDFWSRLSRHYTFFKIDVATSEFSWRVDGTSMTSSWRVPFDWAELIILARNAELILERPHLVYRFFTESYNHLYRLINGIESEPSGFTLRLGTGDLTVLQSHLSEVKGSLSHHTDLMKRLSSLIEDDLAFCANSEEFRPHERIRYYGQGTLVAARCPPAVSIILPLYNACNFTDQVLKDLLSASEETSFEIIAIDNHSTDATRNILSRYRGSIHAILNDTNRNFSGACNQGAAVSRGEYLLFLNNDVELFPGWLDEMVKVLRENDDVAVVGNLQLYPGGARVHHAGMCINEHPYPVHYLEGVDSNDPRILGNRIVQCVTGSCLLIRSGVFHDVGGFDESYRNGYEDVDLCLKVGALGNKIMYTSRSRIIHHVSRSPGRNRWGIENERTFFERWRRSLRPDRNFFLKADFDAISANDQRIHSNTTAVFMCTPWCDAIQFTFMRSLCRSVRRLLGHSISRADLPRLLVPASVSFGHEDLWISRYEGTDRQDWALLSKRMLDTPHTNIFVPIVNSPHLRLDDDFLSFLSHADEHSEKVTIITDLLPTDLDSYIQEFAPSIKTIKLLSKAISLGSEIEINVERCWWHLNIDGTPLFQLLICGDGADISLADLSHLTVDHGPIFLYRSRGIWSDDESGSLDGFFSKFSELKIAGFLDARLSDVRLFSVLICARMVSYTQQVDSLISIIVRGVRDTISRKELVMEIKTVADEIVLAILNRKVKGSTAPPELCRKYGQFELDPRMLLRF